MARGSVRQRSPGSWALTVELDRRPDGRRKQVTETVRGTKREADQRLAALLTAAAGGRVGEAGRLTVGVFLADWLRRRQPNLMPKTHAGYACLIKHQIVPLLGHQRLDRLRPAHLLAFTDALATMTRTDLGHRGEPLSARTQRAAVCCLRTALAHAVRWRLIPDNPATAVPTPRVQPTEMRVWTAEQASAFLAAAPVEGLAWHTLFALALHTGMRWGELAGLRWVDLEPLEVGVLRVVQTITYVTGAVDGKRGPVTKGPKSAAGRRSIPLGPGLVALLRRHKVAQLERRLGARAWEDWGLVLPNERGRPLTGATARAALHRVAKAAGVPAIRQHDLRHSCATLLLSSGVQVRVVAALLGHANAAITMRVYAHCLPGQPEAAAVVLEGLLGGAS